jgi:hypothetical protein
VHRKEQQRPAEDERQERHAGGRHVYRNDVAHGVADVCVDAPAEARGGDDGAEVVLEQHQRRRLARDVGAASCPWRMPMCAALSAGASFTPSPVIATTSPAAL